jgi:YD repeat-containing protein
MMLLAGLSQNYDKAGNITLAYSADRGTSYVYRYDHHHRLTGVYDFTNFV